MEKLVMNKELLEQVNSKLKKSEKPEKLSENDAKNELEAENSKLSASKNIFSRGDFDDWKISDEELEEHEIDKSYSQREFVNGNGKRKSYWRTRTYDGIEGKSNNFTGKEKKEFEFDLKTYNKLSQKKIKSIKPCTDEEFSKYCDDMIKNNHRGVPGLIKINGLKGKLQQKLHLDNVSCFIIHDKMFHISPRRKGAYNQALRLEEYKQIPKYIREADFALYDVDNKSFIIFAKDLQNDEKINFIAFNKDKKGNYFATAGKRAKDSFYGEKYKLVGEGFEPSIPNLLKSLPNPILSVSPTYSSIIAQTKNKSIVKPDYNGANMLNKSFDITVENITENNKNKKIDQVEKALTAIYKNQPFKINHIPADDSTNYGSITLRISNFDKNKIEKAVHKLAFSLDGTMKPTKGEAFRYKAQEQLVESLIKGITEKTKAVYEYVIGYFGLPEIRVVSKADLTHNGKVVYNPETGKPITQAEWKAFVDGIERFLNRNYNGVGEKIVLSAHQLGVILDRIQARKPISQVEKMTLEEVKQEFRSVDWIQPSIKQMTDIFGDTFDRWRQARLQIAVQSAGTRITNVTDSMRNNIQQILIDGIKNMESRSKISQQLFDKCVGLNRDMQRIADTETVENVNNAYLQEEVNKTPDGEKVYFRRFEYSDDNTCKKCEALRGTIALWSDTALPDEHIDDPFAEYAIWEGKNSGEMPNGVLHPYCRGSWGRYYPEAE